MKLFSAIAFGQFWPKVLPPWIFQVAQIAINRPIGPHWTKTDKSNSFFGDNQSQFKFLFLFQVFDISLKLTLFEKNRGFIFTLFEKIPQFRPLFKHH